jgi:hypothetical protein
MTCGGIFDKIAETSSYERGWLMEPLEIATELDFLSYRDYMHFSIMKNRLYRYLTIIGFVPPIVFLFCSIWLVIEGYASDIGAVFFAIAIVFAIVMYSLLFRAPKMNYPKLPRTAKVPQHFHFYKDRFETYSNDPITSGNSKVGYADITRVYETHKAFYINISVNMAYVIPKKYMPAGTAETLRMMLTDGLDKKRYKICY